MSYNDTNFVWLCLVAWIYIMLMSNPDGHNESNKIDIPNCGWIFTAGEDYNCYMGRVYCFNILKACVYVTLWL